MCNLKKEIAIEILDCFEELLDEKEIDIPSDDRDFNEDGYRICGSEYYNLREQVIDLLEKFEFEFCRNLVTVDN